MKGKQSKVEAEIGKQILKQFVITEEHLQLAEKHYPSYNWRYKIGEGWVRGEEGRNDATLLLLPSWEALQQKGEK